MGIFMDQRDLNSITIISYNKDYIDQTKTKINILL